MKNLIYGLSMLVVLVLSGMLLMSIFSCTSRKHELYEHVSTAVETTMNQCFIKKTYPIVSEEEFLADFTENLVLSISSNGTVRIMVHKLDLEKGIFSVTVREEYPKMSGQTGELEIHRTIVWNKSIDAKIGSKDRR